MWKGGIGFSAAGGWRRQRWALCQFLCCAATVWVLGGCAKIGPPLGGEVDRDPPVVLGHTPGSDATDVPLDGLVVIEFSEGMERRRTREAVFIAPRSEVGFHWRGRNLELSFDGGLKADRPTSLPWARTPAISAAMPSISHLPSPLPREAS